MCPRLQLDVPEAAARRARGCSPTCPRLQPDVPEAATLRGERLGEEHNAGEDAEGLERERRAQRLAEGERGGLGVQRAATLR